MNLKSTDNFVHAEITTSDHEGLKLVNTRSLTVNISGGALLVIEKNHVRIIRPKGVSVSVETLEEE